MNGQPERVPIAAFKDGEGDSVVICDDGSVWFNAGGYSGRWEETAPIPGTQRAQQLGNKPDSSPEFTR